MIFRRNSTANAGWRRFWQWQATICPDEFPSLHVILRYDKAALDPGQSSQIVWQCEKALEELARWHRFSLRPRPTVFILANSHVFRQVVSDCCGAICLLEKNAVVLPAYGVPGHGFVDELIRHELAHLFTAKWNRRALPLLNEGFATWWQRTAGERAVDERAHHFFQSVSIGLGDLVDPETFYARKFYGANYALAGSFSGFLIRRFGRDRYREFYKAALPANFAQSLSDIFTLTLTQAEVQWRVEVATAGMPKRRLQRELRGTLRPGA